MSTEAFLAEDAGNNGDGHDDPALFAGDEKGEADDAGKRTNRHWAEWEYGCLIDKCLAAIPYSKIAAVLDRTPAACERMFKRLIDGDAEAPAAYKQKLDDARSKFLAPPRPSGKPTALGMVIEQYKRLAGCNSEIKGMLTGIGELCNIMLAVTIVNIPAKRDEVIHLLNHAAAQRLLDKVEHIREYRRRQSGIVDQQPADPETSQEDLQALQEGGQAPQNSGGQAYEHAGIDKHGTAARREDNRGKFHDGQS